MSVEYQQMNRGSLRPANSGSRLPILLIAALTLACMFFAYNHYVTSDERDVYRADLAHEVRKAAQLEQDKRELMTKNEGIEQELKQAESVKNEQALKVTNLGDELATANKNLADKTAELEEANQKLVEAESKAAAAEQNAADVGVAEEKLKDLEQQIAQLTEDKNSIDNRLNECLAKTPSPAVEKKEKFPKKEKKNNSPMDALVNMAENNAANQKGESENKEEEPASNTKDAAPLTEVFSSRSQRSPEEQSKTGEIGGKGAEVGKDGAALKDVAVEQTETETDEKEVESPRQQMTETESDVVPPPMKNEGIDGTE